MSGLGFFGRLVSGFGRLVSGSVLVGRIFSSLGFGRLVSSLGFGRIVSSLGFFLKFKCIVVLEIIFFKNIISRFSNG